RTDPPVECVVTVGGRDAAVGLELALVPARDVDGVAHVDAGVEAGAGGAQHVADAVQAGGGEPVVVRQGLNRVAHLAGHQAGAGVLVGGEKAAAAVVDVLGPDQPAVLDPADVAGQVADVGGGALGISLAHRLGLALGAVEVVVAEGGRRAPGVDHRLAGGL